MPPRFVPRRAGAERNEIGMAEETRASSGPFAADEVRSTPGAFGAVPVERGVERGTGVADATGRLLWADDTFCTILGRRRERILGTQLADVLTLDLRATAGATISTGLVPVPAEPQAQTPRVTALCGREGRPWAFVVELESLSGESIAPSAPLMAAFVLDGEGSLAAVWGPSAELVGFGRAD